MKTIVTLSAFLLLSGCLGVPEGAADYGDSVTLDWQAFDALTGNRVAGASNISFVLGGGGSGLGLDVERQLVAASPNEPVRIEGDLTSRVSTEGTFGPFDLELAVPLADFARAIGTPELGLTFQVSFYNASVIAHDDAQVTYRVHAVDGQSDPVDFIGATLITHVHGDSMTQTLEPVVGATFVIQRGPGGETPLGLAPGAYMTVGKEGTMLVFDQMPGSNTSLFGVPLVLELTITAVVPAAASEPDMDKLGARRSPQLLGDGAALVAPDGHTDHTH